MYKYFLIVLMSMMLMGFKFFDDDIPSILMTSEQFDDTMKGCAGGMKESIKADLVSNFSGSIELNKAQAAANVKAELEKMLIAIDPAGISENKYDSYLKCTGQSVKRMSDDLIKNYCLKQVEKEYNTCIDEKDDTRQSCIEDVRTAKIAKCKKSSYTTGCQDYTKPEDIEKLAIDGGCNNVRRYCSDQRKTNNSSCQQLIGG